ncbi:MAG: hypothetical protein WBZ36_13365 [Candidatus Nitrosopolaris sp.]
MSYYCMGCKSQRGKFVCDQCEQITDTGGGQYPIYTPTSTVDQYPVYPSSDDEDRLRDQRRQNQKLQDQLRQQKTQDEQDQETLEKPQRQQRQQQASQQPHPISHPQTTQHPTTTPTHPASTIPGQHQGPLSIISLPSTKKAFGYGYYDDDYDYDDGDYDDEYDLYGDQVNYGRGGATGGGSGGGY